jgi:hypothetical protein
MSETLDLKPLVQEDAPPPPYESVKWRVRIGEREYGPYPRTRLIQFLREGRIKAHTLLCCGSDAEFIPAERHPNLRWSFAPPRRRRFGEAGAAEAGDAEPPVCNYFIAGRFSGSLDRFEAALQTLGKSARAADGMWVLRSRSSVQHIRTRLAAEVPAGDQFVIINATRDRLAWHNVPADRDLAMRDVWDAEDVG